MKKQLLFIILLLVAMTAAANPITQNEAWTKAQAVLRGKTLMATQTNARQANGTTSAPAYYVFNAEDNGGFVIVSGDDQATSILAYSDQGHLDLANMPPAMATWLEDCEKQIALIASGKAQPRQSRSMAERATVEPLLKTLWHQAWPYNLLTPTNASGNHYVTGCVATALAQIMYYYHAPLGQVPEIPAYNDYYQNPHEGLPATTFDWANMLPDYRYESNEVQQQAVAQLMQYCGYASKMHYASTSVTITWEVQEALKNFFGFDESVSYMYKRNYDMTWDEWEDLIYNEVSEKRPVVYGGDSNRHGGHAYLIDGYRDGLFHINWGFQTGTTGYYALSLLDYYHDGDGWSQDPEAVVGIKLPASNTPTVGIHADHKQVIYGEDAEWSYTVMTPDGPDGEPTFSCERTLSSAPGNYVISMERGTITNTNLVLGTGMLTVYRAPLSVSTDTVTIMQGDPMPEFVLHYKGFMNNENESVLSVKPTVTPSVDNTLKAGTYQLNITGPSYTTNYNISYHNSQLIILPEPTLTITVHNDTITYGDPLPTTFAYDVEGEMKGGEPELFIKNKAWPAADEYEIIASRGTLTNLNIVFHPGKLVVLPAPLLIAVEDTTIVQGDAMPEVPVSYSGWKYDDNENVLTTPPTVSIETTDSSVPGTYAITVGGAQAANYAISYQNALLTILKRPSFWLLDLVGEPSLTIDETTTLSVTLHNPADEDYTNGILAEVYRQPEHPDSSVSHLYTLPSSKPIAAHGQTEYSFEFSDIKPGLEHNVYLLYFADEHRDSVKVATIQRFVWEPTPQGIATLHSSNPHEAVFVYDARGRLLLTTTAARLHQSIATLPHAVYVVLTQEQHLHGLRGKKLSW